MNRSQNIRAECFGKNFSSSAFVSDILPYGDANSERIIIFSLPSIVRPQRYSVEPLFNIGTVNPVLVNQSTNMLSTTISITIWKPTRDKKFKSNFLTKNSARMFCFRLTSV